ncbi:hypothetical protein [Hyalangium versicolor]|uniref:hypothetical protein n=1 Tax=Hyalangium versicolor TaxID=2861190 RepID=UPI001CC90DCF|nr:hypothetical protein [Hyalangium versicolor]
MKAFHPGRRLHRLSRTPLLLVAALLFAPLALASGYTTKGLLFLSAGGLVSGTMRPEGFVPAYGVEASLHGYPREDVGIGLFGQWQEVQGESPHSRFAVGPQLSYRMVGMELGATYEGGDAQYARTVGLHLAPFVSIGVLTASLRLDVPLWHESRDVPHRGYDVGGVLAIKIPLPLKR